MSDKKSWEPRMFCHTGTLTLSHSITLDMLNNFGFHLYAQKSLSHSHSLTLSHCLTVSPFLTLTLFQSLMESLLTCWTTFVFISMLKSHSHTLTLSHSHTLTLSSHSLISLFHSLLTCWTTYVFISMLKSRCLLQKWQCIFLHQWFFWQNFIDSSSTLSTDFTGFKR